MPVSSCRSYAWRRWALWPRRCSKQPRVPIARGLRDIQNREADPHLAPRVAQFRIEIRLAGGNLEAWCRVPGPLVRGGLALLARAGIFVYEMALISLAIQIGLALPMVDYFHRISFTGLTANVIIVPLLEAAVPIGFLAIFTGWHAAAAARGLATENCRAHRRLARAPGAGVARFQPSAVAGAQFRGVVDRVRSGDAQRSLARRRRFPQGSWSQRCSASCLWQPWTAPVATHSLELTAIDVGQGDSLLVVFPEGRTMVIDGGGVLQFWTLCNAPLQSGYRRRRGLALPVEPRHPPHRHPGRHSRAPGSQRRAAALLENFRPRELWVGANPSARCSGGRPS